MSRVPIRSPLGAALAALAGTALAGSALAGCGAPPEVDAPGTPTPVLTPAGPGSASPSGSATPTVPPAPTVTRTPLVPSATGFPDTYAVSCAGRPSGEQIVRLLRRRAGLLPDGVRARVDTGPLCSGGWHYTVVVVTGREPLAVVTRGEPGALRLVTAGTNVCSIPVRTQAPIGIRTAAAC